MKRCNKRAIPGFNFTGLSKNYNNYEEVEKIHGGVLKCRSIYMHPNPNIPKIESAQFFYNPSNQISPPFPPSINIRGTFPFISHLDK